jgi:ribonuclease HII
MAAASACGWTFEDHARESGAQSIAGVDEVGRGPLFGPVVAAAVILPAGCRLAGLNDSKQLRENLRERLALEICDVALGWAIAAVDAATIDRINIRQASLLAMREAVGQLTPCPDFLLIDGRDTIAWSGPQMAIVKGDATSFSIAAASVLAKVHRDQLLVTLDREYPGYGLAKHKGYPCPAHIAALQSLGPTPLHRRSFRPVALAAQAHDG